MQLRELQLLGGIVFSLSLLKIFLYRCWITNVYAISNNQHNYARISTLTVSQIVWELVLVHLEINVCTFEVSNL